MNYINRIYQYLYTRLCFELLSDINHELASGWVDLKQYESEIIQIQGSFGQQNFMRKPEAHRTEGCTRGEIAISE